MNSSYENVNLPSGNDEALPPLMMTVLETVKYTGLPERLLRAKIRSGDIVCIKSGNRTYINVDKLIDYLNTAKEGGQK